MYEYFIVTALWILNFSQTILDLSILLGFYFLEKQPLRIIPKKGCS